MIAVSSERVDDGPLVRHELSVEITVSHTTEDGADALLDELVRAVRAATWMLRSASYRRWTIEGCSGASCTAHAGQYLGVVQCVGRRYGARRSPSLSVMVQRMK